MTYDYYYDKQSETYSFFSIPRLLITDPHFKRLSIEAKLLYGLLLDRMKLSAKNGWYDDFGRVYIYYTVKEIQEDLCCGHEKAGHLLQELDNERGIGLIERVKRGQGKPTIIYVKQFIDNEDTSDDFSPPRTGGVGVRATDVKVSDFRMSRNLKTGGADIRKAAGSYNNINQNNMNNTYSSYTDPSIVLSQAQNCGDVVPTEDVMDGYDMTEEIKEQLDFDLLITDDRLARDRVEGVVAIINDVLTSPEPYIRVNGHDRCTSVVKAQYRKLTRDHIVYVFDSLKKTTTEIMDYWNYMQTALYRAPIVIGGHIDSQVRHDMKGG